MNLITLPSSHYVLLDSGSQLRLEKFGNQLLIKPENTAIWHPVLPSSSWHQAQASYIKKQEGKLEWKTQPNFKTPWIVDFELIQLSLRLGPSKNIGVFPEQQANWAWIFKTLKNHKQQQKPKVLNLFGYTGGATLVAAKAGAEVCHVDASKAVITWARDNQKINQLDTAPIRWIEEDCLTFMKREIKRGNYYDAIIMDPPAFGRDPKGKNFAFEDQIHELLQSAKLLLSQQPLFLLLNGYAMGYPAEVMGNLLKQYFSGPNSSIQSGELQIQHQDQNRILSCGVYGRVVF